jgi:small subunit ribosomal protein S1
VKWGELRGFVPASQLVDFPSDYELDLSRSRLLTEYVGTSLHLRIIELDRYKNRLILSERAAQTNQGAREQLLANLKPGDICDGTVTNLCNFGAFIDLGGVEGLVHISELSWGRVNHPSDILQRGKKVKVYVLDVVPEEGRVVLSVKRLHPDPWAGVEARYKIGELVTGTVTNVVDFGAFIGIEEGLEGLVHISELAEGQFLHPYNVVQEGQQVTARILHIDGKGRRLGLSLRQVNPPRE